MLDSSRYGNVGAPVWSPDSKWIAYSKADATRTTDVYLIASSGEEKEPHKVTFDSNNDTNPAFAPDGRKLFFQRVEASGGNAPNSVQIYSVALEHLDRDPDDAEERAETQAPPLAQTEDAEGAAPVRRAPTGPPRPPREIRVDWAGLKHRTRQITRMPFPISSYRVAPDSRTIVFVTSEPAGMASVPVIYSIQDDGKRLTRITSGAPPSEEGDQAPGGGGFGGGVSELKISRDGRTLFFREREAIYSVPLPAPAPAGAAATGGTRGGSGGGEGTRRRLNFNVKVRGSRRRPPGAAEYH